MTGHLSLSLPIGWVRNWSSSNYGEKTEGNSVVSTTAAAGSISLCTGHPWHHWYLYMYYTADFRWRSVNTEEHWNSSDVMKRPVSRTPAPFIFKSWEFFFFRPKCGRFWRLYNSRRASNLQCFWTLTTIGTTWRQFALPPVYGQTVVLV